MSSPDSNLLMARSIAQKVREHGGSTYFVGGYVRDALMGKDNKDIDIEVHGIAPACLEEILDSLGERIAIGESFGIYNLKGCTVDIAMPRKEKLRGSGHRDFDVLVDPFIGTQSASKRRDFTVNALMQDVLSGEIIDHYNGRQDLKNGIIRHVNDDSFAEDPLRVLRAAQFAARFDFTVAEETIKLCSGMDLSSLSRERIEGELKKALLKAEKPSIFFEVLRQMEQLSFWFPELEALIGIEQSPKYHAEGDVWKHTMMVVDEAAKLRDRVDSPLGFMYAAVVHDFGKAVCTEVINGQIHSYDHETLGLPLAEKFLRRITNEAKLIEYALNLTELHMKPNTLAAANASLKSTNKMFDQAIDPAALVYIAIADDLGRIVQEPHASYEEFLWYRLEVFSECMNKPYVMGRDLIENGIEPGKDFTELLSYAHKLRVAGVDKENALKQVLAEARKLRKGK